MEFTDNMNAYDLVYECYSRELDIESRDRNLMSSAIEEHIDFEAYDYLMCEINKSGSIHIEI
jgi:hypothetical protein